jgi:hypothetical protein
MADFSTGQVVHHSEFGAGKIVNIEGGRLVVNFVKAGAKFFSMAEAEARLSDTAPEGGEEGMDRDEIKDAIREVLLEEGLTGSVPMAEKWDKGELIIKPGRPGVQEKSVPIETFFHKVVMIRNNLRVLEQNINSSKVLTDSEKVDLQQYITRCYGTLTTFNVLFADKKDWFVGMKSE